jgi:hypothetical protein
MEVDSDAEGRNIQFYAWVMNIGRLVGRDEFELAPGHILRRANADEIRGIRGMIEAIPTPLLPWGTALWRMQWPWDGGPTVVQPESEWRYFVVSYEGLNGRMGTLEEVFDIAPLELEVGLILSDDIRQFHAARLFHGTHELNPTSLDFFKDVTVADVETITRLREKLERHDHGVIDLKKPLLQLRTLKAMQRRSALRFLGYFSVLESLLTHNPSPSDTIDSITRQVKRKLALLDHRWTPRLNYAPFGTTTSEKVWVAMYAYRSAIAHGATVNFQDRDLRPLGNEQQSLALLIEAVKAIVRYALDEPQLVADLKDC